MFLKQNKIRFYTLWFVLLNLFTFVKLTVNMLDKTIILLGESIAMGESKTINMEIAKLHTTTKLKIPIIVERSKIDGPTVLFTAAIHGDEINGIEIVRQLIVQKINKPKTGTIICIPIVNVFGFVNKSREFPDGRDLNRVFPGSKNGSLASRFAYHILKEIIPFIDYCVDFHAGGASRFNVPQIRIVPGNEELKKLAAIFDAPFTLYSKNIVGSFRNSGSRMGVKMLLFEGGKSLEINETVTTEAVNGVKRLLFYLNMLSTNKLVKVQNNPTLFIEKSSWIRAKCSGLLHDNNLIGTYVKKGDVMGLITDPFGKFEQKVKAPNAGYIINANLSPIVYEGDAVYHLSNGDLKKYGVK